MVVVSLRLALYLKSIREKGIAQPSMGRDRMLDILSHTAEGGWGTYSTAGQSVSRPVGVDSVEC